MRNKGLVVVNAYEVFGSVAHMVERLREEFSPYGITLDVKNSSELKLAINKDETVSTSPLPYDFAIFLDKDPYVSILLEKAGLRLFNNAKAIASCDDKVKTFLDLLGSGVSIPKTIPGPLRYSEKENLSFLEDVESLGYPIVVKENYGSRMRIFNTRIPFSVRAAEASAQGISVFIHAPKNPVALAYKSLIQELLTDTIVTTEE